MALHITEDDVGRRAALSRPTARHLLVVEDNPGDAKLLELAAGDAWADAVVTTAGRLGDARHLLTWERPDCILLDLSLPDAQGLEAVATLAGTASDVAIVVITGRKRDDLVLAALAEGAQDYLMKDELTAELLRSTVDRAIERKGAVQRSTAVNRFGAALLNTIDAPTVALDNTGTIVATNEAWNRIASTTGTAVARVGIGTCYLEVCDRVTGPWSDEASAVAAGIRSVLCGEAERFVTEYPFPVRDGSRWYSVRVACRSGMRAVAP